MSNPVTPLRLALLALCAGLVLAPINARAEVPPFMQYQGYLTSMTDAPVSGFFTMSFALYAQAESGEPVWSEEREGVEGSEGRFSLRLGDRTPIDGAVFRQGQLYLQVTVEGDTLEPREAVSTVAHAFHAGVAENAVGDITPRTVSIGGQPVIDENGNWVGAPTGLAGPQGERGETGAAGAQGDRGVQGDPRSRGERGPQGDRGAAGERGVAGDRGAAGERGQVGAQGSQGDQGAQGERGSTGAQGERGPAGPQGPTAELPSGVWRGSCYAVPGGHPSDSATHIIPPAFGTIHPRGNPQAPPGVCNCPEGYTPRNTGVQRGSDGQKRLIVCVKD